MIFNSYVKLPEGNTLDVSLLQLPYFLLPTSPCSGPFWRSQVTEAKMSDLSKKLPSELSQQALEVGMAGTSLDRHIWSCFGLNMSTPWFLRRSDPDELGRLQTRPWLGRSSERKNHPK